MSENFAELLEENTVNINRGDLVSGDVLKVSRNSVLVDIGFKSSAEVPASEFKNYDDKIAVREGDIVDLYVESLDNGEGEPVLSREKARSIIGSERMNKLAEEGSTVTAIPYKSFSGGLFLDIDGIQGFMPNSLVDVKPVRDVSFLLNKPMDVKVLKVNKERNNLVVSRKALLADKDGSVETFLKNVKVGDVVKGIVKNVVDYGAFIDLGGVDGLLHITDMSWKRESAPYDICKFGDELEMKIINYDPEKQRISLSLKEMNRGPWEELLKNYKEGDVVEGVATKVTDYGIFVNLDVDVEGLVHSSEITWKARDTNPEKYCSVGDKVIAKIVEIDNEKKKVSLSIKRTTENPWESFKERNEVGDKVVGVVSNITDHGTFVDFKEGVTGIIPLDEISWSPERQDQKLKVDVGDEISAVVKSIDSEKEKLLLSLREKTPNPIEKFFASNKDQIASGQVYRINRNEVTVKLSDNVYGKIRHEDVGIGDSSLYDVYSKGEDVKAKVIGKENDYLRLSVKAMA